MKYFSNQRVFVIWSDFMGNWALSDLSNPLIEKAIPANQMDDHDSVAVDVDREQFTFAINCRVIPVAVC